MCVDYELLDKPLINNNNINDFIFNSKCIYIIWKKLLLTVFESLTIKNINHAIIPINGC